MDLFDYAKGRALKERGMAIADLNTEDGWKQAFVLVAADILTQHGSVTAEEVVEIVGQPPASRNAIGARMSSFAKANKLSCTYEKAKKPSAHARIIARWFKP